MTETKQRYHSNKQEFLALKWAVTEQFHEYLSPYGKNRNEFVVWTDNNQLTYIFSSANLDAAGQRWVAQLASYNFALEYQKGKDNTVADFLSHLDDHLPPDEVQDYLNKIPYPGVKAVLDNAITPLNKRAEQGVRPNPDSPGAGQGVTVDARPARLATTNITNWKLEQQEDPVLYQAVKHCKASKETFKGALLKVTDRKAVSAYVKSKDQLIMKNGLLYRQSKLGQTGETVLQFVVPQAHRNVALDGYIPYFLLFGRKARMPVDCLFPTLHDSPHQARMEVSVAAMQKRLKEAFAVARHLTSQEVARQRHYYDRRAGAVALQPGDIVMVRADGFVGKRKVKDWWEDGGFIVESQLEDWPVYKVRCPTSDVKQKPKYHILHRNRLLLVTNEDDPVVPGQLAQAKVNPLVSNATLEAKGEDEGPSGPLPSLLTQQEGDTTSRVWLNGEFHTKPWIQLMSGAPESPPDQSGDEVSDLELGMSDFESEVT